MRRIAALAIIALTLFGYATAASAETQAPAAEEAQAPTATHRMVLPMVMRPSAPPPPSAEDQVLELINAHRANAGCRPLLKNLQLTAAAEGHSQDMSTRNFFSHTGSNGSSAQQRAAAAGYPDFLFGGENIAAGQATPQAVVTAWMNSAGHRANILNCSFKSVGIGYIYEPNDTYGPYRHYWSQDFGNQ